MYCTHNNAQSLKPKWQMIGIARISTSFMRLACRKCDDIWAQLLGIG